MAVRLARAAVAADKRHEKSKRQKHLHHNALIIFARKPALGRVKTRLAATIGDEAALRIYVRLLAHTREVALQCGCDVHVFLTEPPADLFWQDFALNLQAEGDLGTKMQDAFIQLFSAGYHHVVIIGSDCPDLEPAHVQQAFLSLLSHDVVIGPAEDGGYYLLGLRHLHRELFTNKTWSGETVFSETIADLTRARLSYDVLPQLSDVDEAADLPEGWL